MMKVTSDEIQWVHDTFPHISTNPYTAEDLISLKRYLQSRLKSIRFDCEFRRVVKKRRRGRP